MMAPLRPAAKSQSAQSLELLKITHDSLRTADEQLRRLNHEIYCLKTAKMYHFPSQCVSSDRLQKHEQRDFKGQGRFESGWWQRAANTGLLESVDNLNRQLAKCNAVKTEFDSIHGGLRCHVNELSRPYLRDLNILDLPDELLLDIFELVEGFDTNPALVYYRSGGRDIQNTRLVCQRFCGLSSQLLVRVVRVNFDEPSLARLDQISRNHNIAKGVRSVRVVLHFYNRSFADLGLFISYHADQLESQVNLFDNTKLLQLSSGTDEQTVSQMIENVGAAISTLRRLTSGDHDDGAYSEDDHNRQVRLEEIYEEYQMLLENQEGLIRSGKLFGIVSSAISRMPCARRLEFSDLDFESMQGLGLMIPGLDVWSAMHRFALQPITGYEVNKNSLELPNYQCIVSMIDAVHSAGVRLNSIDIELSTLGCPGDLVPPSELREDFSSGMQHLKEFKFRYAEIPNEQDAEDLNQFLSACLATSSLEKLSLDMRNGWEEIVVTDIGRVMDSRPRKELTDIYLGRIAVDPSTLVGLLERLPDQMRCLFLSNVRLLSGTWEEALDALRKKSYRVMLFREPEGAECDNMSREDYEMIFREEKYGNRSEAELYIANLSRLNPLRALEEGFYSED